MTNTIEELEAAAFKFECILNSLEELDNAENKMLSGLHITRKTAFYIRNTIRAALEQAIDIERGEKVVVTREPTEYMREKGQAQIAYAIYHKHPTGRARAVYKAMITAAQEEK